MEVDTPLLMPTTNTDANIASSEVVCGNRRLYLQTSPEYAMKRLLAAGSGSIFQIGHAFRDGERGRLHNPEFSLLEWYRSGYDYWRLMDEMELLITSLSLRHCEFTRISYRELFKQTIDIDVDDIELKDLRATCDRLVPGSEPEELGFDQCLDLLLGMAIAPTLQGWRGQPAADLDALVNVVLRVQDFAVAHRDTLYEFDINPVIVGTSGAVAVDGMVWLAERN